MLLKKRYWTISFHHLLQYHLFVGSLENPQRVPNCVCWQEIGRMKTCGTPRFPNCTRLAKSLPISNADTQRVFSIVRKIVTDYFTEMDKSMLCALVSCNLNSNSNCYDLETPKELLKRAKVATVENNRECSNRDVYLSHVLSFIFVLSLF